MPSLGRKKKSQAPSVEAKGREWEHYNVTISGFGMLGTEKATEVINTMERADWELVSQSSSEEKYGQLISLVFRRPNVPGAPTPPIKPVVARPAGCGLFIAMMPFALGATVAMLQRRAFADNGAMGAE